MTEEKYFIGSDLKFKVEITASGFNQNTDEYTIDICCGNRELHFTNEDVITEGGSHYLLINTDLLRPGIMKMVVTAKVPDHMSTSGKRREVDVKNIGTIRNV